MHHQNRGALLLFICHILKDVLKNIFQVFPSFLDKWQVGRYLPSKFWLILTSVRRLSACVHIVGTPSPLVFTSIKDHPSSYFTFIPNLFWSSLVSFPPPPHPQIDLFPIWAFTRCYHSSLWQLGTNKAFSANHMQALVLFVPSCLATQDQNSYRKFLYSQRFIHSALSWTWVWPWCKINASMTMTFDLMTLYTQSVLVILLWGLGPSLVKIPWTVHEILH